LVTCDISSRDDRGRTGGTRRHDEGTSRYVRGALGIRRHDEGTSRTRLSIDATRMTGPKDNSGIQGAKEESVVETAENQYEVGRIISGRITAVNQVTGEEMVITFDETMIMVNGRQYPRDRMVLSNWRVFLNLKPVQDAAAEPSDDNQPQAVNVDQPEAAGDEAAPNKDAVDVGCPSSTEEL